ncbi:MAG TPA: hypothetical protein PKA19_15335 [Bacillota bacterium]|nr:hypothetical protein [Bacillota bacterium]
MQLRSDYYDTDFEFTYKGNRILVRNDGPEGESLFVNGDLQDQNFGAHNGHLIGHIFDEDQNKEVLEVFLGGRETHDCAIYVNGELIQIDTPAKEHAGPGSRDFSEPTLAGKRKNKLFFLLLAVILVTACIILLPSILKDAVSPGSAVMEKADPVSATPAEDGMKADPSIPEKYIEVDYAWNYGKDAWTYHLKIPESTYEYYKTVDRNRIRDYSYYVTDSTDDEALAALAKKFREAAKEGNYSDLDMVKNIVFFVQNLEYVDDKVGTGYDEYPKFPLETLADQGGDCEDSAILLASLLRELGYGTVLLQFKDHMAAGVKGEDSMPGSYYEVNGSRYYYVETTSPGWDIGVIPDQMKNQPAQVLLLDQ